MPDAGDIAVIDPGGEMQELSHSHDTTRVRLLGGPQGLPDLLHVSHAADRITVDHLGRHEHFEATGRYEQVNGDRVAVYRWIYTTKVAE